MFPSLVSNNGISTFTCEACEVGKYYRASFAPINNKSSIPFTLIYNDVWGPSRITSLKGHRWFVSFIDDCSRITWLYMMKENGKYSPYFKTFIE